MATPEPLVILIGLRASGKTSVGRAVAAWLGEGGVAGEKSGSGFVDLDDLTAASMSCRTPAAAIKSHGIEAFRAAEASSLADVLRQPPAGVRVIALGGGTPTAPGAADLLRTHAAGGRCLIVYLRASAAELKRRLRQTDLAARPSLTRGGAGVVEEVDALLTARDPLYRDIARYVIEVDQLTIEQAADAVVKAMGRTH